jgi:hypothetical protein
MLKNVYITNLCKRARVYYEIIYTVPQARCQTVHIFSVGARVSDDLSRVAQPEIVLKVIT